MSNWDDYNDFDETGQTETFDPLSNVVEHLLIAIDCSATMRSQSLNNLPLLDQILSVLVQLQLAKVFHGSERDQVGILLYNTRERRNEYEKSKIYVLQDVSAISVESIERLQGMVGRGDFEQRIGSADGEIELNHVLDTTRFCLTTQPSKGIMRKLLIITNNDVPNATRERVKKAAIRVAQDLLNSGVEMSLLPIQPHGRAFRSDLFYNDMATKDKRLDVLDTATSLDHLLTQVRLNGSKKRSLWRVPFEITKDLVIGVKGYASYIEAKMDKHRNVYLHGEDPLEVKVERTMVVQNELATGGVVDVSEGLNVESVHYAYTYGGQQIKFSREELSKITGPDEPPVLRLLGFKPLDALPFEHNMAHSTFLYPDKSRYQKSTFVFNTLLKSMHKKKKFALCKMVARTNSTPVLVALLPQMEKIEQMVQVQPPGFQLVTLPYGDAIRKTIAPIVHDPPSDDMVLHMKEMLNKLSIAPYNPLHYPNPKLERKQHVIKAYAFHEDMVDTLDATLMDPAQYRLCIPLVQAFHESCQFPCSQCTVEMPTNKRKAGDAPIDQDRILELYSSGDLNRLTVPELKAYLKSIGEKVPATWKKQHCLDRLGAVLAAHGG
jgi:ATP-dependent DNA helicase 2 subunit 1